MILMLHVTKRNETNFDVDLGLEVASFAGALVWLPQFETYIMCFLFLFSYFQLSLFVLAPITPFPPHLRKPH